MSRLHRLNAWVLENEGIMRLAEVIAVIIGVSVALMPIFQTRDNIKLVREQIEQFKTQFPIRGETLPEFRK
jgi:hypothetical protein